MMTAAVVSSRRVPSIRPAGLSSVSPAPPLDLRHHRHARFEAGQAQGQFGEDQQRDADHHERVAVRGGQGLPPVPDGHRVGRSTSKMVVATTTTFRPR